VEDTCGNVASTTARFSTVDTTPPMVETEAQTVVHECIKEQTNEQILAFINGLGGAIVSDSCSDEVSWANERIDTVLCGTSTETIVVFEASDDCGNTVVTVGNLTIRDTEPPVIVLNGTNPQYAEAGVPWRDDGLFAAEDACHGPVHVGSTVVTGHPDTRTLGTYNVTYAIKDECGVEATAVRTVHVVDRTPPTITVTGPRFVLVRKDQKLDDWPVFATDVFDGDVTAHAVPDPRDVVSRVGRYEIFYRAADASGNIETVFGRVIMVLPPSRPNVDAVAISMRFDTELTAPMTLSSVATRAVGGGRRFYVVLSPSAPSDINTAEGALKDALFKLPLELVIFHVRCMDSGVVGVMCHVDASVGANAIAPHLEALPMVSHIHQGSQGFSDWVGSYDNEGGFSLGVVRQELERAGLTDYRDLVCDQKYCTFHLLGAGHDSVKAPRPTIMPMSLFTFDAVSSAGIPLSPEEVGSRLLMDGIVPLYLNVSVAGEATMHLLGARDPTLPLPSLGVSAVRETIFTRHRFDVDTSAQNDAGSGDVQDLLLRHGLVAVEINDHPLEHFYEVVFEQPVTNAQIKALESDNEVIIRVQELQVELPPQVSGPVHPYSFVVRALPELVEGQPLQRALEQLLEGTASGVGINVACANTTDDSAGAATTCEVSLRAAAPETALDTIRGWSAVQHVGSFEDRSLGEMLRQAMEVELLEKLGVEREQLSISYGASLQRARRREDEVKDEAIDVTVTVTAPSSSILDEASFVLSFELTQATIDAGANASDVVSAGLEDAFIEATSVEVNVTKGQAKVYTSQYVDADLFRILVVNGIAANLTDHLGTSGCSKKVQSSVDYEEKENFADNRRRLLSRLCARV